MVLLINGFSGYGAFFIFLIFLVCFSEREYERLKSEATALEDAIDSFRREKDSYIADIRTLEQSCKDVMRLMLESIQKYDQIKGEIREARNELESCADNLVFDLVDLN